jgi:hypothetical protein
VVHPGSLQVWKSFPLYPRQCSCTSYTLFLRLQLLNKSISDRNEAIADVDGKVYGRG